MKRRGNIEHASEIFAFVAGYIMGWTLVKLMFDWTDEYYDQETEEKEDLDDVALEPYIIPETIEWGWKVPINFVRANYNAFRDANHLILDDWFNITEFDWLPTVNSDQMLLLERRLFELSEDLAYDYALKVRDILNMENPPFPGGGLPTPPLELYEQKGGYEWVTVSPSMYQLLVTPPYVKARAMIELLDRIKEYVEIDEQQIERIFKYREQAEAESDD